MKKYKQLLESIMKSATPYKTMWNTKPLTKFKNKTFRGNGFFIKVDVDSATGDLKIYLTGEKKTDILKKFNKNNIDVLKDTDGYSITYPFIYIDDFIKDISRIVK